MKFLFYCLTVKQKSFIVKLIHESKKTRNNFIKCYEKEHLNILAYEKLIK